MINKIEESIRNYYKKEADAIKIRSRVKWAEDGENQHVISLISKRNVDKINYGIESKQQTDVTNTTLILLLMNKLNFTLTYLNPKGGIKTVLMNSHSSLLTN